MQEQETRYSQNFLRNKELVKKILNKSNIRGIDLVLEIGPGKGIITDEIAKRCKKIIAIEKDRKLYELLKRKFKEKQKIKLILGDFLNYNLPKKQYKIFSNIPFDLTADVVSKITSAKNSPEHAYLIVQKEAAKKFIGFPYSKKTQMYTLLLKPWFDIKVVYSFKKTDFKPMPQVDTVLIHIKKRKKPLIKRDQKKLYQDFIVYGFSQWKPTLKKALQKIFTYKQLKRLSKDLKFDLSAKPTELNFDQWIGLFNYFLIGVDENKKLMVYGSRSVLKKQQKMLQKVHRSQVATCGRG
ncbi:23S ribosomal RNA methyltransferase Erm [bacterium]|nr:23S ribosomal RNA methyltransferase Erm [bacterium]